MIKFKVNSCDGVYDSLDVRFTKKCDNNCSFCIEKKGINNLGEPNVEAMISSTLKSGKKDILILGGEPLLYPELILKYINGIRKSVDTIYLTSSLPKIAAEKFDIVSEIIYLLDGINISFHHYDVEKNNEILKSSVPYNRLDLLAKLLKDKRIAKKIRVCCNLTAGYISSHKEIDIFAIRMASIGVQHIKFNELQNVKKDTYISFEKAYGIKMKSPFSHGCQTDISNLFNIEGLKVTLKRSCFCNVAPEIAQATFTDLIKCLCKRIHTNKQHNLKVMYENGDIYEGWQIKK